MKAALFIFLLSFGMGTFAQKAPFTVKVIGYDGKPYAQDKIMFVGQTKKDTYSGITDDNGQFRIELPAGQTYDVRIQSIGDVIDYNSLDIPALGAGQYYTENTLTIQYEAGFEFTLSNLQYETGKADLKTNSLPMLNNLVDIMKRKRQMRIEIDGHTDSDGDEQANLKLSQMRAESVKNYLIQQGIAANRMVAKGFGESTPIADNTTTQGKAKNRRTEIKILQ